ncbi:lipoprotein signal peptidase [Aquimarina sp. AD10]|uniref:Lipoprotein signal peptidase n=1 Tax=Aquimarina aggregata TaxID=1642818 RepID=A0A162ZGT7_9FLAO|nr:MULTISPECIES: lipoprotein signal peptidase [Aquimarina]AXT62085.1 lipoprotein signal peptidase [Aquimarina sp. AD10]KZS39785.1 lipoprotein signal peptidase [Aquimarina aggregata]RKM99926.1 lipoprotein signal peptidase [Aquimarina sp. AD10]
MSLKKSILVIILVLLIDQISKVYIKTHFSLHEEVKVLSWFRIVFVENKGMAWGVELPGSYGKLILTLFRLVAISGIGYWLYDSIRKNSPKILTFCIALIFAGAFGNIIDSVLYGVLFEESTRVNIASFLPADGGYETLFYGKVVDMIQFTFYDDILPDWIPFWGGEHFSFFDPVFNIADSAISVGVFLLIVFYKKAFPKQEEEL